MMLKFLTQPVTTSNSLTYIFRFYVKNESLGHDIEKTSTHYVKKLRKTLLEINKTLPRFAQAKWYTPMPFMDKKYDPEADLNTVSLIDNPDGFISEVIKENKNQESGISIYHAWDGIHPVKFPAYFYYGHTFDFEEIVGGDRLDLHFYVPLDFEYRKDWRLGFSIGELEQITSIINRHYDIIHADLICEGFPIRMTPENSPEDYYEGDYSVFPHRFGVTWMTVLDKQLSAKQVPEAAKVVALEKGRTLVMSVADDYFSSYNPDHVLKANLLELRLHHLGVLRPLDAVE